MKQVVRSIAHSPWQTAVIVVSLALGTGASAAVYSAVDALLFRAPAGVTNPLRLVDIFTSRMNGGTFGNSSYPDFLSIASAKSIEAAAAIEDMDEAPVRAGDRVGNARVAAVSRSFWETLGSPPRIGTWGGGAVISTSLWTALGSDPGLVGRTIAVGSREYAVTAIAPDGFRGLHLNRLFDVWVPLDEKTHARRGDRRLSVIGRLRDGATPQSLDGELATIAARLADEYPETNKGTLRNPDENRRISAVAYTRLDSATRSRAALFGTALLGATALLLISACVNAGSLMLSRGIARRVELTIQTALGAGRGRLVGQVVLEGLLMAIAGTLAGVLVAAWTAGAIPALFAPEHAALLQTSLERPIIAATMVVGVVAGIVFALVPALISTRGLSPSALRDDAGRVGERHAGARVRMSLVGIQLAMSTVFLIASALLVRFADTSLAAERSWAAGDLALASIETYDPAYREKTWGLLHSLPAVSIAGWVATPPLGRAPRRAFTISHGPVTEIVDIDINFASPEYFAALHVPAIEGRLLGKDDDRRTRDVAVVTEALAQSYFAGRAVGQTLVDAQGHEVEIVGVVNPRSYRAFEGEQRPMLFLPMSRATGRGFYAVLRSHVGATGVEREAAAALVAAGGATKVDVLPFAVFLERALAADRVIGRLVALCGALALALALVGVYGVMIETVRRRRREFGLRAALGASPARIVFALVGSSLTPAAVGVGSGIGAAFILTRVTASIVFGLPPLELTLVAEVVALMAVVVLVSIAGPARTVLRISPLVALRQ